MFRELSALLLRNEKLENTKKNLGNKNRSRFDRLNKLSNQSE